MRTVQHSDARAGRGASNGYNENWNNSPFWDKTKERLAKERDEREERVKELRKNPDEKTEEEKAAEEQRKRMRRIQAAAY